MNIVDAAAAAAAAFSPALAGSPSKKRKQEAGDLKKQWEQVADATAFNKLWKAVLEKSISSSDWWQLHRFLIFAFTEKGDFVRGAIAAKPLISLKAGQGLAAAWNINVNGDNVWDAITTNFLQIYQDKFKPGCHVLHRDVKSKKLVEVLIQSHAANQLLPCKIGDVHGNAKDGSVSSLQVMDHNTWWD